MRSLLNVVLVLAAIAGLGITLLGMGGQTAIQEIEGLIGALIATVAISAGYIATVIDENGKKARGEMPVVKK